jgi:hypothetical protein
MAGLGCVKGVRRLAGKDLPSAPIGEKKHCEEDGGAPERRGEFLGGRQGLWFPGWVLPRRHERQTATFARCSRTATLWVARSSQHSSSLRARASKPGIAAASSAVMSSQSAPERSRRSA